MNDPKLHLSLHHSVVPCYLELELIPVVLEISEGQARDELCYIDSLLLQIFVIC